MLSHQDVIAEILDLPDGPEIGAFFDFDGTIISGYSAIAFFKEQLKRGHMSPRDVVELMSVMASFGIGILGFPALMLAASQFLRGVREDRFAERPGLRDHRDAAGRRRCRREAGVLSMKVRPGISPCISRVFPMLFFRSLQRS